MYHRAVEWEEEAALFWRAKDDVNSSPFGGGNGFVFGASLLSARLLGASDSFTRPPTLDKLSESSPYENLLDILPMLARTIISPKNTFRD